MKLTKPAIKTLAALIIVTFLGARGWTSARDLEKRSFVLAVGFDANPAGGFKGHFHIVVPRAITSGGGGESGGGGGTGGQKPILMVTATAPSLWEVRQAVQEKVNNPLFLGHLQAIVVGEDLARQGIRQLLDNMLRTAEIRRRAWIMVAEGTADKVLSTMPKLEQVPSLYLARILETEDYLQLIPMLRLSEFLALEANPGEEPVAILLKSEKDTVSVSGLAAFKGDRLVGKLNTREMHHFLLAAMGRGLAPERITSPNGEGELVYLITGAKRSIRPFVQGNKVSFSVRIRLEGNIMEKSAPHSLRDEEYLRAVEAALSEKIQRDCRAVLRRFQKDFRTDAYGFGNILRARYPKVWQGLDWEKEFPDVPINIRVEAKIRRLGMGAN